MNPSQKLNSAWTFYYVSRKEKDYHIMYSKRLLKVGEFATMEEFLKYYLNLKSVSEIKHNCDISLFKQGYQPLWENCPEGGYWLYRFKRTEDLKMINNQWEKIILSLISEHFNEPHILGATLSIRSRETIIEIWFNYCKNEKIKKNVLDHFKGVMNEYKEGIFYFKDIKQSLNEGSTLRNVEAHLPFNPQTRKSSY